MTSTRRTVALPAAAPSHLSIPLMSARPALPLRRTVGALLLNGLLLCGASAVSSAQSAQKYALQVAVLGTGIRYGGGTTANGVGIEPQLRFNRLLSRERFAISLGIGAQYTSHTAGGDKLNIAGAFLEPRFVPVIGSSRVFPYLSGRLAFLQQSSNFGTESTGLAFGAGGGLVLKLSNSVNLDAGVQLVRQQFGDFEFNDGAAGTFNPFTTYAAKVGLNFGFPR